MGIKEWDDKIKSGVVKIFGVLGKTTSILIASLFLIFSLGALYGFFIAHTGTQHQTLLLLIPPALGIFAYFSRGFAVFIAVILLLVLLI